jgi:hypothetical protein
VFVPASSVRWSKLKCEGLFSVFTRAEDLPDTSPWFHAQPGSPFNQYDFASFAYWNRAEGEHALFVPKGVVYFRGTASGTGCERAKADYKDVNPALQTWLPGDEAQIFLPVDVLHLLLTPSREFRAAGVSEKSYRQFLRNCAPAFEAQRGWQWEWQMAKQKKDNEAANQNSMRGLQEDLKALSLPSGPFDWQAAERRLVQFAALATRAFTLKPGASEQLRELARACASLRELARAARDDLDTAR